MFIFGFMVSSHVFAVTETSGDLQVTYDEPLFPSNLVWYPGLQIQKVFTVKNIGGEVRTISLKADNTRQTEDLAYNLYFRIDEGATNRYGGSNSTTMKNFWDNGETHLSEISSGNIISYTITIYMPVGLGNEFQDKNAQFDLVVGFIGTESKITIGNAGSVTRISVTPPTTLTTTAVTSGSTPDVLGITTSSAQLKSTGNIKGEKTQSKKQLNWFIVFLVIAFGIPLLRIYFLARKNGGPIDI